VPDPGAKELSKVNRVETELRVEKVKGRGGKKEQRMPICGKLILRILVAP
jgi:hypothetical protein